MSILKIQFPPDFEERYIAYKAKFSAVDTVSDSELISCNTKYGVISINLTSGRVKLNNIEKNLNPTSREFLFLRRLIENQDKTTTYDVLLTGDVTKAAKMRLTHIVKKAKVALGILPKEKPQNKDIIENIKRVGYRLIT
jgi:DNA-binding response OmpR family regulator